MMLQRPQTLDERSKFEKPGARMDLKGDSLRPCDFEELQEYDEDTWIDAMTTILARQNQEEDRLRHQAVILVRLQTEVDRLVHKLNSNDDSSAVGIYSGKTKALKMQAFRDGKYKIAVVCGYLPEGYQNSGVSLCVILRKVGSLLLFREFIEKCLRMEDFPGGPQDGTRACVLTLKKFGQSGLWKGLNSGETKTSTKRKNESELSSATTKRRKGDKEVFKVGGDRDEDVNQFESDLDVCRFLVEGDLSFLDPDYVGGDNSSGDDDEEETDNEESWRDEPNQSVEMAGEQEERISPSGLLILDEIPGMKSSSLFWCSTLQLVKPEDEVYGDIVEYIKNGQEHNYGVKLLNLLRVTRANDPDFDEDPQLQKVFRMLLWHGTEMANIPSILQNGFRLPVTNGQMFGPGIYFADRISKSCNYCDASMTRSKVYLFLCEVLLGNIYNAKNPNWELSQPPKGFRKEFDSVMCTGKWVPDRAGNRRLNRENGTIIPCGPTIKNTKFPSYTVNFNEYIVYDLAKIRIKFVVQVEFPEEVYNYS